MWSQPSEVLCTSALMEVMHRQGNKKLRKIFLENFSFVLKIVFSEPLRLRLPILPICLNFVTERDKRIQKCTFAEHRHIANKAALVSTIGHLCHTNTTHFALTRTNPLLTTSDKSTAIRNQIQIHHNNTTPSCILALKSIHLQTILSFTICNQQKGGRGKKSPLTCRALMYTINDQLFFTGFRFHLKFGIILQRFIDKWFTSETWWYPLQRSGKQKNHKTVSQLNHLSNLDSKCILQ